jgi:hypothetical protein
MTGSNSEKEVTARSVEDQMQQCQAVNRSRNSYKENVQMEMEMVERVAQAG